MMIASFCIALASADMFRQQAFSYLLLKCSEAVLCERKVPTERSLTGIDEMKIDLICPAEPTSGMLA